MKGRWREYFESILNCPEPFSPLNFEEVLVDLNLLLATGVFEDTSSLYLKRGF
jgi:hypothetical protein